MKFYRNTDLLQWANNIRIPQSHLCAVRWKIDPIQLELAAAAFFCQYQRKLNWRWSITVLSITDSYFYCPTLYSVVTLLRKTTSRLRIWWQLVAMLPSLLILWHHWQSSSAAPSVMPCWNGARIVQPLIRFVLAFITAAIMNMCYFLFLLACRFQN